MKITQEKNLEFRLTKRGISKDWAQKEGVFKTPQDKYLVRITKGKNRRPKGCAQFESEEDAIKEFKRLSKISSTGIIRVPIDYKALYLENGIDKGSITYSKNMNDWVLPLNSEKDFLIVKPPFEIGYIHPDTHLPIKSIKISKINWIFNFYK